MTAAEQADNADDGIYGKGKRGDRLPEELRFKESRLKKIEETNDKETSDCQRSVYLRQA